MKVKKISIISSGDEILTGRLIDTNSAWLSKFALNLGYEIVYFGIAGDNIQTLQNLIYFASQQSDIVIISGGLGPTEDDKTRYALANLTHQKLVFNFVANHSMYSFYKKLGRDISTIPSSNYIQCMIPVNSSFIANLQGTACGIASRLNDTQIIALPGVPHEMKNMMEFIVSHYPHLLGKVGDPYMSKVITVFGLSEARLGEMIKTFMIGTEPLVGITAKSGYIQISVMGFLEAKILDCINQIKVIVKEYLISEEGKTPPEVLLDICRKKKWTLGTIESCTGGLIADAFISIPGSSEVFQCGVVSYSNEAKIKFANVSLKTLEKVGAVSEEIVKEMANGFALNNKIDVCLSSSGVAGPDGGTIEKPVGTVCLGLFIAGKTFAYTVKFGGNRQEIRIRSAMHAICLAIQLINKK